METVGIKTHLGNSDVTNRNETMAKSQNTMPIIYVYSNECMRLCDLPQRITGRASMVHSLISSYGLVEQMHMVAPRVATEAELTAFHSQEYIDMVKKLSQCKDEEKYTEEAEQFGLTYECPVYPWTFQYASLLCGASMTAAQHLIDGTASVAINWFGGWHHAKRDEASGYCYFNDAVLAILKLREKYEHVLYIDLDLHHGDGVEDAFCSTSKVMTVSFHQYAPGFFPGTGSLANVGMGKGKFYTINVPLREGIQDEQFITLVKTVLEECQRVYKPEAVVCQCGSDGLTNDPMSSFNLTLHGLTQPIQHILTWKLPTLLLGGGGYHLPDTARCWANLTATALGQQLPPDIPEHRYFTKYGPDFELQITPGLRTNKNDKEYIQDITEEVLDNIDELR